MPLTIPQINALSISDLEVERDRYMTSNPEYTRLQNWITWRTTSIGVMDTNKSMLLSGPGSNPLGNPPPPPGV